MKTRDTLAVFNRGRISRHAIARTDVSRVALAATVQTNWFSWPIGPMSLRPGLQYLGALQGEGVSVPFVFRNDDAALIDLSPGAMRIWASGTDLVTRVSVSATITNGTFNTGLTGWTDADESGATSQYRADGLMELTGTGLLEARRRQTVAIGGGEQGTEHGLRVTVERGPVYLRIGTSAGLDDVFRQAVLRTGSHSIAFTPGAASIVVEFASPLKYPVLVRDVAFEAAGPVSLPTPWATADDCRLVRWAQSGDVIFCACDGYKQRRIERRDNNSWSIAEYDANDGPFLVENLDNISLTPSGLTGEITLTASQAHFRSGHVGALFQLTSSGQRVEASLASANSFTDPIRVTGVSSGRTFQAIRSGSWSGTLTLQRSVGEPGDWVDVANYTTNATTNVNDGFDNSIIYYRIGFTAGNYSSGTAEVALDFAAGSITGTARVTAVADAQTASAVVVNDLGGTDATTFWAEGAWSDLQGWPTAVAKAEGRLWWTSRGRIYGSVSEAFTSYDPDFEGDAGPINKGVGEGATDRVNWILALQRLVAGGDDAEHSIRSNSFDEPITPSNYNSKNPSTVGSAKAPAAHMDGNGYFIGSDGRSVYEMTYDAGRYDFRSLRATVLVPEIGDPGLVRLAVAKMPEVRLFVVRTDGTVAVLLRDPDEDVLAWQDMTTDGFVEDVAVLPGSGGDRVFFRVRRTINGATVRYLERLALMSECEGDALCRLADAHVTGTGPASILTGLGHLEGKSVVVWADGMDLGAFTVSGGQVALEEGVDVWCAGLGYEARWKSAKLAGQTAMGLSLTQESRINKLGLVLADTHAQGLQYGPDFDTMDDLPLVEDGADVDVNAVREEYDGGMVEFPGDWGPDNRICLKASAPRPATVLAVVANVDRQDHD